MDDVVVELRRYTLHPGARDRLIELFERRLIEPQEAVGMSVLGQFRDLDAPDSFVWLRGFADMRARRRALESFYGGPIWEQHKDEANATMIDSDDVRLLRPLAGRHVVVNARERPDPGEAAAQPGLVTVTTYSTGPDRSERFEALVGETLEPVLTAAGADVRAMYRSHRGANNFPRLPVREGESVVVVVATFADENAHARHEQTLAGSRAWHAVAAALADHLAEEPHTARLVPTGRSLLHG